MANLKTKLVGIGLAAAMLLVPVYEGLRLKTYLDPIGIPTDCFGHTGKDVVMGATNTLVQCNEKLYADLLTANKVVDSCVTVPLNGNQRSAFVSFAYNVGGGRKGGKDGFCILKNGAQPSFLRALNKRDYTVACNGLLQWVNAAGKPLRGLVLRRGSEVALCLKGVV